MPADGKGAMSSLQSGAKGGESAGDGGSGGGGGSSPSILTTTPSLTPANGAKEGGDGALVDEQTRGRGEEGGSGKLPLAGEAVMVPVVPYRPPPSALCVSPSLPSDADLYPPIASPSGDGGNEVTREEPPPLAHVPSSAASTALGRQHLVWLAGGGEGDDIEH